MGGGQTLFDIFGVLGDICYVPQFQWQPFMWNTTQTMPPRMQATRHLCGKVSVGERESAVLSS